MKQSGPNFEVNEYNMSIHYGVCWGPIDALLEINVDEKVAWSGFLTSEDQFNIIQPNLFGGNKKEGGLMGTVRAFFGGPSQVIPDHIASKMGETSATCPAYRGIFSLFFFGGQFVDYTTLLMLRLMGLPTGIGMRDGFCWKANVPYLPGTWARVRRRSRGLNDAISMIGEDTNPAHMIYECLTNTDWGLGASPTTIDVGSMEAAAMTLYNEAFGLSMIWTSQTSIENFINEVLDHIQAVQFLNPRTGLLTLKLIRADYDVAQLPRLTPDNSKITKFSRKSWAETTNEIVLTWTNPSNEQEETVIVQDLGNITQQGSSVSDSRNYYGIRNIELATRIASRDLRAVSAPIASFEIEVDRSAWDMLPGGVVKLTDPDHGIYDMVLRIGPIDYGKPGQPTIKITATEDVFTQQTQAYVEPPSTGWVDTSENPAPFAFLRPFTLPAFLSAAMAGRAISSGVYPEVLVGFLASQRGNDTVNYELIDNAAQIPLGTRTLVGTTTLQAPLPAQSQTVVTSFSKLNGMTSPKVGQLVFFGDNVDSLVEIAVIRDFDESGWKLDRGVLDTTPRAWGAGTRVWFVNIASTIYDARAVAAFDTIAYKLLPRTSRGLLNPASAPVTMITADQRPYRPLRPANVKIGAVEFGTLTNAGSGPWTVAWANRNRMTEDAVILPWNAGPVQPEANQTTTITVYSTAGVVLTTHTGLTGNSFSLPKSSFKGANAGRVQVSSSRDGFTSLQAHEIAVSGIT